MTSVAANTYLLTIKEGNPDSLIDTVIAKVNSLGGKVLQKYDLYPGIKASLPASQITAFEGFSYLEIEADGVVHTMDK